MIETDLAPLHRLVQDRAIGNRIVLVFANDAYRLLVDNWLAAMARIGVSNLVVIAFDSALHDHLELKGIACHQVNPITSFNDLCKQRIATIRLVASWGFDVIHSDPDAVWIRDPLPGYLATRQEDVIMSQGTVWPVDVFREWHFVVCCGFFMLHPTPAALQYIDDVLACMDDRNDDQEAFNRALFARGVRWSTAGSYDFSLPNGRSMLCSRQPMTGQADGLSVSILPHHLFQRLPGRGEDAYVKHLLGPRVVQRKIENMKREGCFFLDGETA